MKNYFRAIRQSFCKRLCLTAGCLFCALMIGILWGGNIAIVVYPITEICLKKDSTFPTWVVEKIEENTLKIAKTEETIHLLKSTQPEKSSQISMEEQMLYWLQWRGTWYRWLQPYVEQYTPKTSFQTVVFLMVIVFIGTIIKVFFLVVQQIFR